MLTRLIISNLAIIENVDIHFQDGFTILTGSTGAGKSLIIDSLSLLLGARASVELIRTGEDKATIKGYFNINNKRLNAILTNLDIPFIDNELIIERTISKNKSTIKINGVNISLTDLNKITRFLADIHNQYDFYKLLNEDNYLDIVDGFNYDVINRLKNEYSKLLNEYRKIENEYNLLVDKKNKIDAQKEFYQYQLQELKGLNLIIGEKEDIEQKISLLKNYDKIYELSQMSNELIHSDFLDKLYELNSNLKQLSKYQNKYDETIENIDNHYFELEDIFSELIKQFNDLEYDPNELNDLLEREQTLKEIERKYKKDIPSLIAYIDELDNLVGDNSTIEFDIQNKLKQKEEIYQKCLSVGKDLSLIRKNVASTIEKELMDNLKDLLLDATFKIEFKDDIELKENGIDNIDFLIQTNVGEGLKPLSKIVSGGEASRIMLAFKSIFVKANKISTIIFDEIDTGISGEVSERVARKIKQISLISQVIAISHMPQAASKSDHHILISKKIENNRTYTYIQELNLEQKINEIAHLISGEKVTPKQLEYAREMVLNNENNN